MASPRTPLTIGPEDEPGGAPLTSWYTQGVTDGFGDRLLMFDNAATGPVELLRIRPEFALVPGFESALRQRFSALSSFVHPGFAQARVVNHLDNGGGLTVASTHVAGTRLSALFEATRPAPGMHPGAVREVFGDLVAAISDLHKQGAGVAHGALSADRVLLTSDRRLVVTDYVFGSTLERLKLPTSRLWNEFGLVTDPASGHVALDQRGDLTQLGLLMMCLVLGRRVRPDEYPRRIPALLADFTAASDKRAPDLTAPMSHWLEQAINPSGFTSAAEASHALAAWPARPHYIDLHHREPKTLAAHAGRASDTVQPPAPALAETSPSTVEPVRAVEPARRDITAEPSPAPVAPESWTAPTAGDALATPPAIARAVEDVHVDPAPTLETAVAAETIATTATVVAPETPTIDATRAKDPEPATSTASAADRSPVTDIAPVSDSSPAPSASASASDTAAVASVPVAPQIIAAPTLDMPSLDTPQLSTDAGVVSNHLSVKPVLESSTHVPDLEELADATSAATVAPPASSITPTAAVPVIDTLASPPGGSPARASVTEAPSVEAPVIVDAAHASSPLAADAAPVVESTRSSTPPSKKPVETATDVPGVVFTEPDLGDIDARLSVMLRLDPDLVDLARPREAAAQESGSLRVEPSTPSPTPRLDSPLFARSDYARAPVAAPPGGGATPSAPPEPSSFIRPEPPAAVEPPVRFIKLTSPSRQAPEPPPSPSLQAPAASPEQPVPFAWANPVEPDAETEAATEAVAVATESGSSPILKWAVAALLILVVGQGGIIMQLSRRPGATPTRVRINSATPGDAVLLDGKKVGVTPFDLPLNAQESVIEIVPRAKDLSDTQPVTRPPQSKPEPQASALDVPQAPTSNPNPAGTVVPTASTPPLDPAKARTGGVRVVSPIPLQVMSGREFLGSSDRGPVYTAAGERDLDFVNNTVGFRTRQRVQVDAGRLVTVQISPPNGLLSVTAQPTKAQVWIDGQLMGDTPMLNMPVPLGEHDVVVRHPTLGERRQKTLVQNHAVARVTASFTP